jgi:hypothetical protein
MQFPKSFNVTADALVASRFSPILLGESPVLEHGRYGCVAERQDPPGP